MNIKRNSLFIYKKTLIVEQALMSYRRRGRSDLSNIPKGIVLLCWVFLKVLMMRDDEANKYITMFWESWKL